MFISRYIMKEPKCRQGTELMGWSQGREKEAGCTHVPELVAAGVSAPQENMQQLGTERIQPYLGTAESPPAGTQKAPEDGGFVLQKARS